MSNRRMVAWILLVGGTVLLVLSLLADALGIGRGPGFGWAQIVGVLVGLACAIVGGWLAFRR